MNNQELQTFLNIIDGRIKKYINENKLLKQYCGQITNFVLNDNKPLNTKYKVKLLGNEEYEFTFLNKTGENLMIDDYVYIQTVGTDLNTGVIIYKTKESFVPYMEDFIIEQGVSGLWNYEKWNSGKLILYRCVTATPPENNSNVLLWSGDLPFIQRSLMEPCVNLSLKASGNNSPQELPINTKYYFSDNVLVTVVHSPMGGYTTESKSEISVHIIGRWK